MPPEGEPAEPVPWRVVGAVALFFLLIIAAGLLFYLSQEQQISEQINGDLSSIANLKTREIASWRTERFSDAETISQNQIFRGAFSEYLQSPTPARKQQILTMFAVWINTTYNTRNIRYIDPGFHVALSSDPGDLYIGSTLEKALEDSAASDRPVLTSLTRNTTDNAAEMYAIAPLNEFRDGRMETTGFIVITIDPSLVLYPLIQSWPVKSTTAETLLVEREGDHVLYLNELRHQPETALNLTIPLTRTDVPAVKAVLGTTGALTGRDYRGVDVVSVIEPVPDSPWYLVTKIDTAEAYSSWWSRSGLIIALVAGTLAGSVVALGLLWQRRQKYFYRSLYASESAKRKLEEKSRERLEILLNLGGMESATEQELAGFVLDAGCRLTDSTIAFVGVISPDESAFEIASWSDPAMKDCAVPVPALPFPVAKAGIWAEAARQRKPVIVNEYPASLPGTEDLQKGHVPVTRFISVPLFDNQRIVMVCTVANRGTGYSAIDLDNLALLVQGVWNHLRKRRADDALRQKTTDLEAAFEEITATDEELRANYEEVARAQQALAESERKYRNLYQYAQVGLFETSFKDGTVVACNRRYADLAGFASVPDAIGKEVLSLYVNPGDRVEVGRILKEQGYIENYSARFRNRATGRIFWGQFSARFNYEQEVAEGTLIDITIQQDAVETLRVNEERYRLILSTMQDAYLRADRQGILTMANPAAAVMYGYASPEEMVGIPVVSLYRSPEDRDEMLRHLDSTGRISDFTGQGRRRDGSLFWVSINVQLSFDADGTVVASEGFVRDITDRKQAEMALRESETRLTMALEVGNAGVWQWNLATNEVWFDEGFHTLLGYAPGELPHNLEEWMAYHNQEDVPLWMGKAEAYLKGESAIYESEHRIRAKDGSWAWVFTRGQFVPSPTLGPRTIFVGIAMNVTMRKNVEEALRRTHERLQRFVDANVIGIAIATPEGEIIETNDYFLHLIGYTREEYVAGKVDWRSITPPEWLPADENAIRELRKRGSCTPYEKEYIRKDGSRIPILLTDAMLSGPQEQIIALVIDITDRKLAENALRESEKRLREAQEMAHLGFWTWDTRTGTVEWSDEVFRIFGLVPGEFEPTIDAILSRSPWPEEQHRDRELIARAMESHEPGSYEQRFLRPDGSTGYYQSTFEGRYDEAGNLVSIVGTALDITGQKLAEQNRELLIQELEQKNAELERFTYTVSHDLKSPLITIRGFATLIEEDAEKRDPVQLKKDVRRITAAADTMQELLSDVLELSRIGRVVSPPENTPFDTIAREAVELLAGPLAARGATVEIAPDLPAVRVDHARIREALVNLIENAIKFSGIHKEPVIRIGVETGGGSPVFFVQDNGIGIDPRYLERIFNLFERLDVSTHGTGIGLPIVRRIIETHGGKIWAESAGPGKGTTFKFTLPPAAETGEGD